MTRTNYLKKFIKYSEKDYDIEESLNQLKDTRKNPTYTYNSGNYITSTIRIYYENTKFQ